MPIEKVCENCQNTFFSYPSENRRFCGLQCRSAFRFGKEIPEGRTPVQFSCKECSKPFTMLRSYVDAYNKRFGHEPMYCSVQCSGAGRRRTNQATHTFVCAACGKENIKRRKPGGRLYVQQKYCDNACKSEHQKMLALDRFNRGDFGRHIKRNGYVWISVPSLVTGKKHETLEHRHIMSRHLGRELLAEETVHHRDGN